MLRKLGLSSSGIWKPKNPHSLEYLKYLCGILEKNRTVVESNKTLLVEALRATAEILIWGDQNDASVFDFFLERQVLSHFLSIMEQKCGSYVIVQLLQTLNILFENIKHDTSLCEFTWRFRHSTQEFPLYTEVIKFFNHNESMVRIAVRTITLNIYKVKEGSMHAFIRLNSRDYFCSVVDNTASHAVDIDHFARSAENEATNRSRLDDLISEHLDHIHYLNDIFLVKDALLSEMLSEMVFRRLIAALYLPSLNSLRLCPSAVVLTPVTSLFLLSQFLLIVTETQASDFTCEVLNNFCQWSREQDGVLSLVNMPTIKAATSRVFFNSYLDCMCCDRNDHATFYCLILLYAICQNEGVMDEILEAAQIKPNSSSSGEANLMAALFGILTASANKGRTVRPVTLELCCILLRRLLLDTDPDSEVHAQCDKVATDARSLLVRSLSAAVYSEELFLEMFEDEYYDFERNVFRLSSISTEPDLLLPPSNSSLSGVALSKRLPSGSEEQIRMDILLYLHLRKFILDLRGESETILPLKVKTEQSAEINDCINLGNSDLLSCTVVLNQKEVLQRFLVADQLLLILVEPDKKRPCYGVVRFVGLLQDTQLTGDPSESRALHIVVNDVCSRSRKNSEPMLCAKFLFDDHIRCMAAKQRLSKGRQQARLAKIGLICDLLEIPRITSQHESRNPFRIVKGCAPGSVRKQQMSRSPMSSKSSLSSLDVPDDLRPRNSSSLNRSVNNIQDDHSVYGFNFLGLVAYCYHNTRMTEMAQAEAPVSEQPSTSLTDDAGDGSSKGLCIVVLGMAGSGKSSFVRRLVSYLHQKKVLPYVLNLDPAVNTVSYPANIDIRDTVNYKEVMKEYNLGPNGAIITCLNLFCTQFHQVLELIAKRESVCPYFIIDTPGQIEAFTWSASGSIITDLLASSRPTMIAYILDSVRAANPTTFMSNMLYACSILYRTKLPFVIVLNKADIVKPTFITKWMKDFESFQDALNDNKSSFMNDLIRSLSLVLDEFYEKFSSVTVSSLTGEGLEEFLLQTKSCAKEYSEVYLPMVEKMQNEKLAQAERRNAAKLASLTVREKEVLSTVATELPTAPVFEKIHIGGVEQEDEEDANTMH
ncbi:unnamed protein product [Enterobius vermicularis]|uniref:GPN-loop GTPase 1 n=1 Tax=Enterobius vermicularis TaxID=51028 RepID=A0A0N4V7F8_ENTVE|nr:unnamed protein product [Enterobius vermicularis]